MTVETDPFVVCVNDAEFGDFSGADLVIGQCDTVLAREDDWLRGVFRQPLVS